MRERVKSPYLAKATIGVDIGGSKIESALVRADGSVPISIKIDTPSALTTTNIIQAIYASVDGVILERKEYIRGIGVGAPGQVELRTGKVIHAPNLSCQNLPLKEILQKRYSLPVFVDNDVRCALLAEHRHGVAKNILDCLCMFVGTGIGGGIMVGGKVLRGVTNSAAEIGHMTLEKNGPKCGCGNYGCLESLASGPKIIEDAVERLKGRNSLIKDLVKNDLSKININLIQKAFEEKDKVAIEVLERAADYIGIGVATLVNILNPKMVILGGGVINASPSLFEMIKEVALKRAIKISKSNLKIVTSELEKNAGTIGASLLVEF
ncbi:ROK family protein [bacterium]|nr:ROK family protein [bacterium]MBU0899306.1 ROK family protein [bacterium]MBU1153115.1 ROK family protein [bacterium]MBU2599222.1 ROK family protein [bacterium]